MPCLPPLAAHLPPTRTATANPHWSHCYRQPALLGARTANPHWSPAAEVSFALHFLRFRPTELPTPEGRKCRRSSSFRRPPPHGWLHGKRRHPANNVRRGACCLPLPLPPGEGRGEGAPAASLSLSLRERAGVRVPLRLPLPLPLGEGWGEGAPAASLSLSLWERAG